MSSDDPESLSERELSLCVTIVLLLGLVFFLVPDDIAEQMFWIATGWFALFALLANKRILRIRFTVYAVLSIVIAMVIRVI